MCKHIPTCQYLLGCRLHANIYKLHLWHMTYGMHMHRIAGASAHLTADPTNLA